MMAITCHLLILVLILEVIHFNIWITLIPSQTVLPIFSSHELLHVMETKKSSYVRTSQNGYLMVVIGFIKRERDW